MDTIDKTTFLNHIITISKRLRDSYNDLHWIQYSADVDTQELQYEVIQLQSKVENLIHEVERREHQEKLKQEKELGEAS